MSITTQSIMCYVFIYFYLFFLFLTKGIPVVFDPTRINPVNHVICSLHYISTYIVLVTNLLVTTNYVEVSAYYLLVNNYM